ncbi:MAG: hypothetical protein JWP92_2514 [Caulobacter sp.]|nr:hypothetical protein [Caulobacter sp.]
MTPLPPRLRKLIGGLGILAFLAFYIWAVTGLFERLPDNRLIQLAYFVVAGLGWGLPLIPLMSWMGKADKKL